MVGWARTCEKRWDEYEQCRGKTYLLRCETSKDLDQTAQTVQSDLSHLWLHEKIIELRLSMQRETYERGLLGYPDASDYCHVQYVWRAGFLWAAKTLTSLWSWAVSPEPLLFTTITRTFSVGVLFWHTFCLCYRNRHGNIFQIHWKYWLILNRQSLLVAELKGSLKLQSTCVLGGWKFPKNVFSILRSR